MAPSRRFIPPAGETIKERRERERKIHDRSIHWKRRFRDPLRSVSVSALSLQETRSRNTRSRFRDVTQSSVP